MTEVRALHTPTPDDLAKQRTMMAADRTLMAWMRTTLSMISFGFTIYKFMQYLYESQKGPVVIMPRGIRNLGLALITLGVVSLALACLQYWHDIKRLTPERSAFSLSLGIAGFIAIIGILALLNVAFRLGPF